ncbi:hypothetical protein BJ138DRAFT_913493 [Hygrophoropsis aurantiaca]|uniref:Uncharacterized protein n=1 Tax=Hygrophoropsis aurantiaca TaxID=72124 RepID=A0ACB8ADY3_9AGAM|nr:hypothetical protein BJ138DRAFT_913493 [Hygrophoropsis aurantiaca]
MADPGLIQELQAAQTTNYIAAAAGALVAYDQVLTFAQEIEHIWDRQWNFITALYLIARYSGTLSIISVAVEAMCINWTYSVNVNNSLAQTWLENIFLVTMQAILVNRVYALFNQSRKVLIFLATLYALQTIVTFVMTALLFNNRALREYIVSIGPVIGSVIQNVTTNPDAYASFTQDVTMLAVVFNTILLFFALWAFVRHASEARALDGGWSINVLVKTLVADHLVYFVCNLIWLSLTLAANYIPNSSVLSALLAGVYDVFSALAVVVGPHMVISLRVIENKSRREGVILEDSLSAIRFAIRESPSIQSESSGDRRSVPSNE